VQGKKCCTRVQLAVINLCTVLDSTSTLIFLHPEVKLSEI
jgi:hypothetical protein